MLNQNKKPRPSSPELAARFLKPVSAQEKRCSRPDCPNFIPAGMYSCRQKFFFCSDICRKWWFRGNTWGTCSWCGKDIRVRTDNPSIKNHFCNPLHNHLFRSDHLIRGRAGSYMPVLQEYLDTYVKTHYRDRLVAHADPAQRNRAGVTSTSPETETEAWRPRPLSAQPYHASQLEIN